MRVLYITTPRRTGAWLAEAFASDSACRVTLEEAIGATDGLAQLRDAAFDAVLLSHEPGQLDAVEIVSGLRAGGTEEPLIILGEASEQEMAALCFEVGADAYVCAHTATTRTVLWIVARATERHRLIRENRRLAECERHRLRQEQADTERLLTEQRSLSRDFDAGGEPCDGPSNALGQTIAAIGRTAGDVDPALGETLKDHYRELLRAHVIMGSGNLSAEMAALAEVLSSVDASAPQTMQLHTQVLEELVRGLGSRSARHVMTRADLLVLEVLVHLAERYRLRSDRGEAKGGASAGAGIVSAETLRHG